MTDVSNGNQYACKIIPKNRMQKIHMQKVRIWKSRASVSIILCVSLNNVFTLFADRAWDHDPQRAESRERRPDASLLRGQSQRVHASWSLSTKGIYTYTYLLYLLVIILLTALNSWEKISQLQSPLLRDNISVLVKRTRRETLVAVVLYKLFKPSDRYRYSESDNKQRHLLILFFPVVGWFSAKVSLLKSEPAALYRGTQHQQLNRRVVSESLCTP